MKSVINRCGNLNKNYISCCFAAFINGSQALVCDMRFQKISQFSKSVLKSGDELEHPTKIAVLVRVEQVLELSVKDV